MSSRTTFTCRLSAAALTAGAVCLGWHHYWVGAVACAYAALVLLIVVAGYEQHDRVVRARHERARRAAAVDERILAAPAPCCQFWKHSDGRAHGPDCTRPPLARRDRYRLDDDTRAVFEEIAAHFDDREAA